jgi:hypothetical protein
VLSAALFSFIACRHAPPAAPAKVPETPEQCTSRAHAFADFVAALPETAVASATRTDLAVATIGRAPGSGPVVEVSPRDLSIDGRPVPGDLAARAQSFRQWVTAWSAALPPSVKSATRQRPALYVAASADTDVHTLRAFVGSVPNSVELRLLVRVAEAPHGKGAADPGSRGGTLAARLLGESDPARASAIAAEGYAEFSKCAALSAAVRAVPAGPSRERWPNLRNAIASSLPSCACTDVDTDDLRSLVSAEQRAGVGSLAYLPLSFVRDERCDASMPLRSVEKLVKQLEQFDAEFSAQFQRDAVTFDDVLTSERLRVYFCDALPGETFAEKAHTRGTLYLHVPGTKSCEAWTFSALAQRTAPAPRSRSTTGKARKRSGGSAPPTARKRPSPRTLATTRAKRHSV